jgi:hypothetical protein
MSRVTINGDEIAVYGNHLESQPSIDRSHRSPVTVTTRKGITFEREETGDICFTVGNGKGEQGLGGAGVNNTEINKTGSATTEGPHCWKKVKLATEVESGIRRLEDHKLARLDPRRSR